MKKALVFLKRKAGLTREEFIEYYETKHVPLVREVLPPIRQYKRNFIDHATLNFGQGPWTYDDGRATYFDVVTEIFFDNQDDVEKFLRCYDNIEQIKKLEADEEKFLDRSMMQIVFVDEYPK